MRRSFLVLVAVAVAMASTSAFAGGYCNTFVNSAVAYNNNVAVAVAGSPVYSNVLVQPTYVASVPVAVQSVAVANTAVVVQSAPAVLYSKVAVAPFAVANYGYNNVAVQAVGGYGQVGVQNVRVQNVRGHHGNVVVQANGRRNVGGGVAIASANNGVSVAANGNQRASVRSRTGILGQNVTTVRAK